MNKIVFSKKSWHWRLATVYGNLDEGYFDPKIMGPFCGVTISAYIKSVIVGFCSMCIIIAAVSVILWPLVKTLTWIIVLLVTGIITEIPGSAQITGALFIIGLPLILILYIVHLIRKGSSALKHTNLAVLIRQKINKANVQVESK